MFVLCSSGRRAMTVQRRRTLSRDAILDVALGLADEGGLAAVTMRRLASRLGVEAMSLYNHVSGKADLLDGIASRVFESIAVPDATLPWDERVRALIGGCYEAMRAHPAVVQALVAEAANPRSAGALSVIDQILGALFDAGLDERAAARGYRSLLGLVFGSVLVETAGPAVPLVPDSERAEPGHRRQRHRGRPRHPPHEAVGPLHLAGFPALHHHAGA